MAFFTTMGNLSHVGSTMFLVGFPNGILMFTGPFDQPQHIPCASLQNTEKGYGILFKRLSQDCSEPFCSMETSSPTFLGIAHWETTLLAFFRQLPTCQQALSPKEATQSSSASPASFGHQSMPMAPTSASIPSITSIPGILPTPKGRLAWLRFRPGFAYTFIQPDEGDKAQDGKKSEICGRSLYPTPIKTKVDPM